MILVGSCGGGSSFYTIGGTISGLDTGEELVAQNNLRDNLTLSKNSSFTFPSPLANGAFYDVTILTTSADKFCSIAHNEGYVSGANVTDVNIVCSIHTYTIGGTVDGLDDGDTLIMQVNLDDDLTVTSDGTFTFPTSIADGGHYDVTVLTAPSGKVCSVRNGSGTISGANVTDVVVVCADSPVSYSWTKVDSGVSATIQSVIAIDESHVWAVGMMGMILFYDGTAWTEDPQSGEITLENLWDITAIDNNHVWAAGDDATILFYDGSTWVEQAGDVPDYEIFSISAVSANNVWAGCVEGWYLTFDGTSWAHAQSGIDIDFKGMQAFEDETWAVGIDENMNGYLLATLGEGWTSEQISSVALSKIRGPNADDLWIVGNSGTVYHIHSGHRDTIDTGSTADFRDIEPLSWGRIWVVGWGATTGYGTLMFFNGAVWEQVTLPSTEHLWSVNTYNGSVVWVVGEQGAIFKGELTQ